MAAGAPAPPPRLGPEDLSSALALLLPSKDMQTTTLKVMRHELEDHFALARGFFEDRKDEIDSLIKELVESAAHPHQDEEDDLGEEKPDVSKSCWIVTMPYPTSTRAGDGTRLKAPDEYTAKQIIEAMLDVCEKTQGPRLAPLRLLLMCDFREKHKNGKPHDHLAVKADRCFRFAPLKKRLLQDYGLASHWSCHQDCYASCVSYGYVPSVKKPLAELDPKPALWAAEGEHPPLSEASRAPVTAKALAQRREKHRLMRAEEGKPEPKFEDVDVWPLVVRENILDGPEAPEVLMGYAKRCGGPLMVKFCFRNWPKLPELIARSWKVERVEQYVAQACKSRMQVLQDAIQTPCCCGGRWLGGWDARYSSDHSSDSPFVSCDHGCCLFVFMVVLMPSQT